jgi:hypothetical protein
MLAQNVSFDEVYDKFACELFTNRMMKKISSVENIFNRYRSLQTKP